MLCEGDLFGGGFVCFFAHDTSVIGILRDRMVMVSSPIDARPLGAAVRIPALEQYIYAAIVKGNVANLAKPDGGPSCRRNFMDTRIAGIEAVGVLGAGAVLEVIVEVFPQGYVRVNLIHHA